MAKHKKIQLKKRSGPAARIHRGLSMPVGPGSDSSTLSFRSLAELKAKYFVFTGRLPRRSFIMRTLVLMFAQLMFSAILYSRFAEAVLINRMDYAAVFGIIFVLLSIPVIWSQLSLGVRRCHDMNSRELCLSFPLPVIWPAMSCRLPVWIRRRRRPSRSWPYPIWAFLP